MGRVLAAKISKDSEKENSGEQLKKICNDLAIKDLENYEDGI
jgi:hypothetical protein